MENFEKNENFETENEVRDDNSGGISKLAAFGIGALGGGTVLLVNKVISPLATKACDAFEDWKEEREEKKEARREEREARREERRKKREEKKDDKKK